MAPLEVVVDEKLREARPDLVDALETAGASRRAESVVEHGPVHQRGRADGARRAILGGAMRDSFHRGQQLLGMVCGTPAAVASVGGEGRASRQAQRLAEGHCAIVAWVARGDRHAWVLKLCERDRAEEVDDNLNADRVHALDCPPKKVLCFRSFPRSSPTKRTAASSQENCGNSACMIN